MTDIFHALFGRYTPIIVLSLLAILFAFMLIFGLNFGGLPATS